MPVRSERVTLVVGSDSLIGSALITELRDAGQTVVGTTRRQEAVDSSNLYLDLSEQVVEPELPSPVSVAILCAGVTSLEACRLDLDATARVNVDAVPALAKELVARGAFVVRPRPNAESADWAPPYRSYA